MSDQPEKVEIVSLTIYPSTLKKVEDLAAELRISRSRAAEFLLRKGVEALEEKP